jgi:starch synthase (maltosyl-transferring)
VPLPEDGRRRVVIAQVSPSGDGGRYAVKRCVGDAFRIEAALVCDGHERLGAVLVVQRPDADHHEEHLLTPISDAGAHVLRAEAGVAFGGELELDLVGTWRLWVEAWVDAFASWAQDLGRRAEFGRIEPVDLLVGAALLQQAAARARSKGATEDAEALEARHAELTDDETPPPLRAARALHPSLIALAARHPDRRHAERSAIVSVLVEPTYARFAAWYELFPRSTGENGAHGTFRTAETWLPYVASMGFDVLYLPPIHPIGESHRKGRNDAPIAEPGDPGSPWAIGSAAGGHTAVHPELGTLDDFERFVREARRLGLRVALDIALQASPDHPWVSEHPSWFRHRPDGSIQYAENPPKRYQDVYPFDFECADWRNLWDSLRDIFLFWIDRGVTIFRVDNPHTKPIRFWEWCLASVRSVRPETTFLSEAFTRPSLKYELAKIGFSQGYTYFTWRNTAGDLRAYMEQLLGPDIAPYFRPSLWPNTPDILAEDLQYGGRAAFLARLVLAGTLSSHYGIYGPAFELMRRDARPGSGEYLDGEKYELVRWERESASSLRPAVTALNAIRHRHPALWSNHSLRFHESDNPQLLCYSKRAVDDVVLVVVSLDPHQRQQGTLRLDADALGLSGRAPLQAHDLFGGGRFTWPSLEPWIDIEPSVFPAQVFALRTRLRSERDFDYYE